MESIQICSQNICLWPVFVLSCIIHNGDGLVMLFLFVCTRLWHKKHIYFMPKVRRKLMDKEPDKMEFKLNELSALYMVQTRRVVWSPLYLNTLEAFLKWNRFHRRTHKSTKLSPGCCRVPTGTSRVLCSQIPTAFSIYQFLPQAINPFGVYH